MKWPETLTLVRHDFSAYNELKEKKKADPLYKAFTKAYDKNPESEETKRLAIEVKEAFALNRGDHNTPLAENAGWQAKQVGERLKKIIPIPTVIFVSPYLRTNLTLDKMKEGWPELSEIKTVQENRLTEQKHGLAAIYNDWRVFTTLHPEQREFKKNEGMYYYRYPQGESLEDLSLSTKSWLGTLAREYSEEEVLAVTHHLRILSIRENIERLQVNEVIRLDREEKPINAGVTIYKGDRNQGKDGKLMLKEYNLKLYDSEHPPTQENLVFSA